MPLIVRCPDKMVFEVDPVTLDPKELSYYDNFCFSDPRRDVEYMEVNKWEQKRNNLWESQSVTS